MRIDIPDAVVVTGDDVETIAPRLAQIGIARYPLMIGVHEAIIRTFQLIFEPVLRSLQT